MSEPVFEEEMELSDADAAVVEHVAHETVWHTSYWPLLVSFGILFLVPLSFISHFVYKSAFLAAASLGIGAPLTLISVAGWVKEGLEDAHGYSKGYSVWAMPLLIVAEALLFVAFFAAYWAMRLVAPFWPPAGTPEISHAMPILMTIILIASSVTIHLAEGCMEGEGQGGDRGDRGRFITWLVVTLALGSLFLGLSAYEWSELIGEGFTVRTNAFSTVFYTITGFHGSHVLVGLGIFACILIPALSGKVSKPFVKAASVYWHFVDVVWLFVVTQVYFW